MLSIINRSGNSLLTLINDILDFSKIEAGKLEIENFTFNLRELLDSIIDQFAIKINEKKLELISHISSEVPQFIIGDESRLMQILLNLISNAIKFTQEGDVFIRIELENIHINTASVHFLIADSGIGIPKEKLDLIFESFTQADGSTSRKYGGTGLGTTISKMLVELMNGNIWVESPNPKYAENADYPGSVFHFIIPFGINFSEDHNKQILPIDISNKKVILVDDNETNLFVLR
jgi:signal transduction histidine kinase